MPCYDDRDTAKGVRAEQVAREQEQAGRLLDWFRRTMAPPHDPVAALCALLRSIPEDDLLNLLRQHFHIPEARELAGWWEVHKRNDRNDT